MSEIEEIRTMNERIRIFDGDYENRYHCEDCPHRMSRSVGENQYPCGQYRCWVCAANGDYENA